MTAHPARLTPKLSSSPKQPQPAAALLQPDSATNSLVLLWLVVVIHVRRTVCSEYAVKVSDQFQLSLEGMSHSPQPLLPPDYSVHTAQSLWCYFYVVFSKPFFFKKKVGVSFA